jgi:REP element-mobilizing transposase RayT
MIDSDPCRLARPVKQFDQLGAPATSPPLYTPAKLRPPAYQLRFGWTRWPSAQAFPHELSGEALKQLDAQWETDGIRRLEWKWAPAQIQVTVSVKPTVSPVFLAGRLKGRLQHVLRQAGTAVDFSRKLGLRSLGDARSAEVEAYIAEQVQKERFVDKATAAMLEQFTRVNPRVNLTLPAESNSGRYWYNLHLVLVAVHRERTFDPACLATLCEACFEIATAHRHAIASQSVMPDHIHLALRCNFGHSAETVALGFLNGLSQAVGGREMWQHGYYAGTFGEYDMGAVRLANKTDSPAGQAGRGGVP